MNKIRVTAVILFYSIHLTHWDSPGPVEFIGASTDPFSADGNEDKQSQLVWQRLQ
jgi:hypothetical protein